MKVTFQKQPGDPALGSVFFWSLTLQASTPGTFSERLIPELYYDYLYVKTGRAAWADAARAGEAGRLDQALKTLWTRPLMLTYTVPLVLLGARLALGFAETYWDREMRANTFVEQAWVSRRPKDLADFAAQVRAHLRARRARKTPYPLLAGGLQESGWLGSYSARHKRRLYQAVHGVSRQALERIGAVQAFLDQACDFGAQRPRIIGHINPEAFYDQPHLNHVFKRLTGLAPVEYFETSAVLQDNLMAASYNAGSAE
jgi:hypothetical protein